MNNSKCLTCNQNIAILNCKTCSHTMCYFCDENLHSQIDKHIRTTLIFSTQFSTQSNQNILNETINKKQLELQQLKEKELQMTKNYQEKILQAQKQYEYQINQLEERLQLASQCTNKMQDKVEELDIDKIQKEVENLDNSLKIDIQKAAEEQAVLLEKNQKVDQLIDRLTKATDIEQLQVNKMNEVLAVFKECSEQLQKEKELLMLDNEKLVGEIEIFAKFFDENGPLLEELNKVKNEQQQQK
ncbi:unnamed protein product [Paramecium primaurelia]|uniref:B box-type domain-containing protein n=1 Tax=Paramecium primaurelia TaxID=5886 RepID=A0A8S1MWB9_PARPR|nr:unnamed protein product [Paramecium primaurelia]